MVIFTHAVRHKRPREGEHKLLFIINCPRWSQQPSGSFFILARINTALTFKDTELFYPCL